MNIMNRLTLRLLKENKRQTLVTLIGVIISVAMLTAVATITVSFFDLLKRDTIVQFGEWHAQYYEVEKNQLDMLKNDSATKLIGLSKVIGYAELEESENPKRPYIYIEAHDSAAVD